MPKVAWLKAEIPIEIWEGVYYCAYLLDNDYLLTTGGNIMTTELKPSLRDRLFEIDSFLGRIPSSPVVIAGKYVTPQDYTLKSRSHGKHPRVIRYTLFDSTIKEAPLSNATPIKLVHTANNIHGLLDDDGNTVQAYNAERDHTPLVKRNRKAWKAMGR